VTKEFDMTRQIAFTLLFGASIAAVGCGTSRNPAQPTGLDSAAAASASEGSAAVAAGTSVRTALNSEQLVFSGTSTESTAGPVGFWIWCEVESDNPYHHECNGAMYFYALGITKHVEDQEDGIQEPSEGIYQIKVQSTQDSSVTCTLQNSAPAVHGPQNTVNIDCSTPSVHAVSSTAVVNVTGPPSH
jgi:hypothetical protein